VLSFRELRVDLTEWPFPDRRRSYWRVATKWFIEATRMEAIDLAGLWQYQTTDSPEFAQLEWDDSSWPAMNIPQNWFLAGLDHHGVVWFRHEFEAELPDGQYATLRFDGVDYFTDVYLNGVHLGHHEGYFESFGFDVTAVLQNGRNQLAVRVDSPFEPVGPDGWHMRKRQIKGVLNHHDCRPGGGWVASGQAYNTGGIWNRVTLAIHSPITVDRVLLQADLDSEPPTLQGQIVVTNRGEAMVVPLTLSCTPDNFNDGDSYQNSITLTLPQGNSRQSFILPVADVHRWQPWDRGFPNLYQFTVHNSQFTIDYSSTFGFRTITVDENYRWTVNGRSYFPRGSNYIASQWLAETLFPDIAHSSQHPFPALNEEPSTAGESWFERDVNLMRAANLNLIRVHAHVLPPEFHAACDRAGILVWQDFPFQWGYSDDPAFHDEAERQARAMIEQLYNHPSIIAWCMHNESPWDAEWMAEEAGGSYEPDHNRALDSRLYEMAQTLDPKRHVQLNSGTGDSHVYPGWYYGTWRDYASGDHGAPFPTEYGAQGIPAIRSTRQMFAQLGEDAGHNGLVRFKAWIDQHPQWALAKDMPPIEEVPADLHDAYKVWQTWLFHNFQPPETFYRAGIELDDSLESFINNSQAYQNQINQFATETYRQNKYSKINGIIQFMFVEPWPAITWAVLDYWRRPKSAYAVLRTAMQPVLVTAVLPAAIAANQPWSFELLAINDLLESYPHTTCRWNIVNLRMQQLRPATTVSSSPCITKVTCSAKTATPSRYNMSNMTLSERFQTRPANWIYEKKENL
jgi:beta-mannosidase